MTYNTQLFPWCIIRPQPNMKQTIVARFRRRSDAESYLHLKQLLPNTPHTVIFDNTPDETSEDAQS